MVDRFVIGTVGAPFGVKGFVKVRSGSGEIDHLLKLQSVIVSKDGKERVLQIEEITPSLPGVLVHFKGIHSPEEAKILTGSQLIAGREYAAPLGEDEFYIEDLKGLPVVDGGEVIGHVTDVIEGGGGELVEIELAGSKTGRQGEKRLVPLMEMFFKEISLKKGKLELQNTWILDTANEHER